MFDMLKSTILKSPWTRVGIVAVLIAAGLGAMAFPPVREKFQSFISGAQDPQENNAAKANDESAELIAIGGHQGLRLSQEAIDGYEIKPVKVIEAKKERPLPAQPGQLNFDNERLFPIPSRFPGEVAEMRQVLDTDGPVASTRERPIRAFDKVKQGDLLAVIWSQQLGTAKAALVDALNVLRLSEDNLKRYKGIMEQGAGTQAELQSRQNKVELDFNARNTAERLLRTWKLTDDEIAEIEAEAKNVQDSKNGRSIKDEAMKWARVEIRVPWFDKANKDRELVIVEKNINLNGQVDPINSPALFKLADISRLQIWAHPPEEFVPIIREGLQKNGTGRMQWDIRFQSDPANSPPRKLDIAQIGYVIDPNPHTPIVFGYFPNPDGKYIVGQFVTATIYVPPDENTVEIPTDALNEVDGQALVFVQPDPSKPDFALRRVAVVRQFKDVTFVRSKLTDEEKKISAAEEQRGHRPLLPLLPGEYVITRGVVELTNKLNDLAVKEQVERNKNGANK